MHNTGFSGERRMCSKKQNNTLKRPNSVREKSINLRVTTAFIAHNSYTNGEIYFGHCRWCGGDISRERVRRTRRWCDLKTAIVVRKQFKRLQKQNEKKPRLLQRDRFAGRKKKKKNWFSQHVIKKKKKSSIKYIRSYYIRYRRKFMLCAKSLRHRIYRPITQKIIQLTRDKSRPR